MQFQRQRTISLPSVICPLFLLLLLLLSCIVPVHGRPVRTGHVAARHHDSDSEEFDGPPLDIVPEAQGFNIDDILTRIVFMFDVFIEKLRSIRWPWQPSATADPSNDMWNRTRRPHDSDTDEHSYNDMAFIGSSGTNTPVRHATSAGSFDSGEEEEDSSDIPSY